MKKYIFSLPILFFLLGFWGCEKDYNEVVDPEETNYKVSSVSSLDSIFYGIQDSVQTLYISFSDDAEVSSVSARIVDSDGDQIPGSPVNLLDNGSLENNDTVANDNKYSARLILSSLFINGRYTINYYITDLNNEGKLVSTNFFNYDNGQIVLPPVLSNLIVPDSVIINSSEVTPIFISVDVKDTNGTRDIKRVFFDSYLPNGDPSTQNPFVMKDDGINGDKVANDGTYTLIVYLPTEGVTPGIYTWKFQALDRRNLLSDIIIHNILVKQ